MLSFWKTSPAFGRSRNSKSEPRALVIHRQTNHEDARTYSSPRRRGRRVVGFFLHSGQGETAPSVLAAGGVAPDGHTHNSTFNSAMQPPSMTVIRPASIPRVLTR